MVPSEVSPGAAGPRTEIGKSIASCNATKTGLFAANDFVRENEADEYTEAQAALHAQLSPEGYLEETFTAEIMTAAWRLRRCRIVETGDFTSPEQKSVDRARAQSHNILRRSLAELRKLQTERAIHLQLTDQSLPALAGLKQVNTTLKIEQRQRLLAREADGLDTLEGLIAQADKNLCAEIREDVGESKAPSSFCKSAPEPPRNAPCPCNSGKKYKHCCARTGAGWPTLAA